MSASKVIKSKKTEIVKKTPNPTYNESFQFKVPSSNTDMFSISVTVMQHAPAMKGMRIELFQTLGGGRLTGPFILLT